MTQMIFYGHSFTVWPWVALAKARLYFEKYAKTLIAANDFDTFLVNLVQKFIDVLRSDDHLLSETLGKYQNILRQLISAAAGSGKLDELQVLMIEAHIMVSSGNWIMAGININILQKLITAETSNVNCTPERRQVLENMLIKFQLDIIKRFAFNHDYQDARVMIERCLLNIARNQSDLYFNQLNNLLSTDRRFSAINNVKCTSFPARKIIDGLDERDFITCIKFLKAKHIKCAERLMQSHQQPIVANTSAFSDSPSPPPSLSPAPSSESSSSSGSEIVTPPAVPVVITVANTVVNPSPQLPNKTRRNLYIKAGIFFVLSLFAAFAAAGVLVFFLHCLVLQLAF